MRMRLESGLEIRTYGGEPTADDVRRIRRVMARVCGFCNAGAGEPCVRMSGSPILNADQWHAERRLADMHQALRA